jgi:hypothetical protein
MTMLLAKYIPHGMSEVNECSTPQCSYLEVVVETVEQQEQRMESRDQRKEKEKDMSASQKDRLLHHDLLLHLHLFLSISLTLF